MSVGNLLDQHVYQFSLFEDVNLLMKEHQLHQAMDDIKFKFGKNAVNRASSELESSTIKARNRMIGGHHA